MLLGAAACIHKVHEETNGQNDWETFFVLDNSDRIRPDHIAHLAERIQADTVV